MKKKLLFGVGVLLLIGGIIYAAIPEDFSIAKNESADYTFISTGVTNELNIEKIEPNNKTQKIKVTFTTDWKGLYLKPNTYKYDKTENDPSAVAKKRFEAMTNIFKTTFTREFLGANLQPINNEDSPTSPSTYDISGDNSIKLAEYSVLGNKAPIKDNGNSDMFGVSDAVFATGSGIGQYDFVFLAESNHLQSVDNDFSTPIEGNISVPEKNMKNGIKNFLTHLNKENFGYRATIIEFGNQKLHHGDTSNTSNWTSGQTSGYTTFNPTNIDEIDKRLFFNDVNFPLNKPSASSSPENQVKVFYSNYSSTKKAYYIQGYEGWLAGDESLKAADLLGKFNQPISSLNEETVGGTNTAYALYEAVKFIERRNLEDSETEKNREKIIVLATNMSFLVEGPLVVDFLKDEGYSQNKDGFIKWFTKAMKDNPNIKILASIPMSDETGYQVAGKVPVDSLGRWVVKPEGYDNTQPDSTQSDYLTAKKMRPIELKRLIGADRFIGYESSRKKSDIDTGFKPNQFYFEENLFDFIGRTMFKQRWTITYNNPLLNDWATWKKVLFSVKDFELQPGKDAKNITGLKVKTVLKKLATTYTNGKYDSTESGDLSKAINFIGTGKDKITDTYLDRYYYMSSPIDLTYKNPDETTKKWKPYPQSAINGTNGDTKKLDGEYYLDLSFGRKNEKLDTKLPILLEVAIKSKTGKPDYKVLITQKYLDAFSLDIPTGSLIGYIPVDKEKLKALLNDVNGKKASSEVDILVKWTIGGETGNKPITASVDFDAPTISGITTKNTSAKEILTAMNTNPTIPLLSVDDIDKLTSVILSSPSNTSTPLYVRDDNKKDDKTLIEFFLNDDNLFSSEADIKDLLKTIRTSLIDNYNSVVSFTIDGLNLKDIKGNSDIDSLNVSSLLGKTNVKVSIEGIIKKLKTSSNVNKELSIPSIKDSFGNSTVETNLGITIVHLSDPDPVSFTVSEVNSSNFHDMATKKESTDAVDFIKKNSTNDYKINLTAIADFGNKEIVGLLLPFTQTPTGDVLDSSVDGSQTLKDFGYEADSSKKLRYETFKGLKTAPTSTGGTITALDSKLITIKTKDTSSRYDGIYNVGTILPVNRAGGIASLTYATDLAATVKNFNTKNLTKAYVVDTISPKLKSIVKTAVVFKSDTATYENNKNFIVPNTSGGAIEIDSSISIDNVDKYSPNSFTGSKPLKVGDTMIIVLNDFSLIKSATYSSGDIKASAKLYKVIIPADKTSFTAVDLAGNASDIKTIVLQPYAPLSAVYGSGAKDLLTAGNDNQSIARFTNESDNLFTGKTNTLLEGIAASYGSALGTLTNGSSCLEFFKTNPTPKKYDVDTYAFSTAGWVTKESKPIVWDYDVHDTNFRAYNEAHPNDNSRLLLKNKVLLTKGNSASYSGIIDLSSIMEYSGLVSITDVSSSKGTFSGPPQILGTSTAHAGAVPIKSNFKVNISMTYPASAPAKDTITFKAVDRLGNTRNFSVEATLVNNITIKGQSQGENKIIESKVNINSGSKKTEIKATKQGTKP